ncbi:hypothetical protein thsrh120_36820 [Rhizobium sp. No.120]
MHMIKGKTRSLGLAINICDVTPRRVKDTDAMRCIIEHDIIKIDPAIIVKYEEIWIGVWGPGTSTNRWLIVIERYIRKGRRTSLAKKSTYCGGDERSARAVNPRTKHICAAQ